MIVDERIITFINSLDTKNSEILEDIEREALADNVPIIRREMQSFLKVLLMVKKPMRKGVAKFGGKKPNKAAIKLPLRDGDIERDDEAYKGHYFINANSTTAPQIVDRAVKPILDRSEVYSGCYARVSLNFYAFNSNGNKGIACGLGNIQKIRDGESLGGKTTAADDFGAVVDDDFLA